MKTYKERLSIIMAVLFVAMFVGLFTLGIVLHVQPFISLFFAFIVVIIAIFSIPNKWLAYESKEE